MEKQIKIVESYGFMLKTKGRRQRGFFIALIKAFGVSSLIGTLYGISRFLLEINMTFIPIIGIVAVAYVYNINYSNYEVDIITRVLLGFICSFQIVAAYVVCEVAYSQMPMNIRNIYIIINEYLRYTLENPIKQAAPIFLFAMSFIYGAMQDYIFRFQMFIKKPFMKKYGSLYYEREGCIISIYIVDPMDYNEHDKNKLIAYMVEGCYIEKHGKQVRAFYLPKDKLDEAEISINVESFAVIEGEKFYKIDLGSMKQQQKYLSPCVLIMDENQNVEVIQIEV